MTVPTTSDIISAIENAQADWTDANWTHEYKRDGEVVYKDEEGHKPIYCYRGEYDDCEVCIEATDAAKEAASLGEDAHELLEEGRIASALSKLEQAASLESDWGDDPVWRPVVRMCAKLDDALGGSDSISIAMDPNHDLYEAGVCNCDACCDAFFFALLKAADELAEDFGHPIDVVRCTYQGPNDVDHNDYASAIWQQLHDNCPWTHSDSACDAED